MKINYDLKNTVDQISKLSSQKSILDNRLSEEYLLSNVPESILLEKLKFKYIGESKMNKYPTYQKGENILAFYIDDILHICDINK